MDIMTVTGLIMLGFWGLCILTSIGFKIWAWQRRVKDELWVRNRTAEIASLFDLAKMR